MSKKSQPASGQSQPSPTRKLPDSSWKHIQLYQGIREAISALPVYFRTETQISGIMATDLHTLNNVLGATIEEQVVRTLNLIRRTWDPKGDYALYTFVRQPQTFPDVRLKRTCDGETLVGLELKGWYLLAKEEEPSLRFTTTADACSIQDLIVVVPWVLSNVISGSPILYEPFIESAKYAAEYRNYHWQFVRKTSQDSGITVAKGVGPYPIKSDQISDKPINDGGGNFGRLARTGIMDEYIEKINEVNLCGIKAAYWRQFIKVFQESKSDKEAREELSKFRSKTQEFFNLPAPKAEAILRILNDLELILENDE